MYSDSTTRIKATQVTVVLYEGGKAGNVKFALSPDQRIPKGIAFVLLFLYSAPLAFAILAMVVLVLFNCHLQ